MVLDMKNPDFAVVRSGFYVIKILSTHDNIELSEVDYE